MALGIHQLQERDEINEAKSEAEVAEIKETYSSRRASCHVYTDGKIHIGWYWDGDGTLAIIENGRVAVNRDCKKDYTWEWCN